MNKRKYIGLLLFVSLLGCSFPSHLSFSGIKDLYKREEVLSFQVENTADYKIYFDVVAQIYGDDSWSIYDPAVLGSDRNRPRVLYEDFIEPRQLAVYKWKPKNKGKYRFLISSIEDKHGSYYNLMTPGAKVETHNMLTYLSREFKFE